VRTTVTKAPVTADVGGVAVFEEVFEEVSDPRFTTVSGPKTDGAN
jgi:hypothetical protein